MYLVFYRTSDVFEAEEALQKVNIPVEIAPTPVQDKAYCGVCVLISEEDVASTKACLVDMDYILVP